MAASEYESVTDGLASPFWELLSQHVVNEWGPAGLRYQSAVRDAAQSANAVIDLQKVLASQEAVLSVMRWPAERLNALKQRTTAVDTPSRRGVGL